MIIALLLIFVCFIVFCAAAYIIGIELHLIRWIFELLLAPIKFIGKGLKKIFHF